MDKTMSIVSLIALASMAAGAKEPWRDPGVFEKNRLPARAIAVPCESEAKALAIAKGEMPRTGSKWLESLNGVWDFRWKHTIDAPNWEKSAKLAVPGCWQLQGDFDPALYTNITYPIAGFKIGDPMVEPPKDYTSHYYRNPVGLYSRTFSLPAGWKGRRIVIHFETYYPPKYCAQGRDLVSDIARETEHWIAEHPDQWSWNYHGNFRA